MNLDRDLPQFDDIPDPLIDAGASLPLPARPVVGKTSRSWATVGVRQGAALAAAFATQSVWVGLLNRRSDLASTPRTRLAFEIVIPLATATIAFWAAGSSGQRGLGNTRGRIAVALAAAVALFGAATCWVTAVEEADPLSFWFHAARCAAYITAFATVPFLLALWAHARAFAALSSWRTCALGVGCGALGACTMSFICETESAAHVIVGHGLAMVIGGFAGVLAARPVTMS